MGMLWLYVRGIAYLIEIMKRMVQKAGVEIFPWLVEVIIVYVICLEQGLCLKYPGRMYTRELPVCWWDIFRLSYILLTVSIWCIIPKKQGVNLNFFPGDLFRWSLFCRCGYPVPFFMELHHHGCWLRSH